MELLSQRHHVPYDLLRKAFVGDVGENKAPAPEQKAENARDIPEQEAEEASKPRGRKKKQKD